MAFLKKNLERLSHCLGTVFFAITVLSITTGLSLKGNDAMKPTRAELRMVNLETAIVVRSMDNLSWQTENLPPVTDHVLILVVGYDNCLFRERLAYLTEESKATIQGRSVRIESCLTLEEASKSASKKNGLFSSFFSILFLINGICMDFQCGRVWLFLGKATPIFAEV